MPPFVREVVDALADASEDVALHHHGGGEAIIGRTAIAALATETAGAFPGLAFAVRARATIDPAIEAVEVELRRDDARVGLLALVHRERGTIDAIELFGPDPRDASTEPSSALAPGELALDADPSAADPRWIAATVEHLDVPGGAEVIPRLSARGPTTALIVLLVRPGGDGLGARHVAAVLAHDGGNVTDVRVYANPREASIVEMNNSWLGRGERARPRDDLPITWGPWQHFCCEQGGLTRACMIVSAEEAERCRGTQRLALECRQAFGCDGPSCFCCSNGIDAACETEAPDEPIDVPDAERPPAPKVWSPY